MWSSRVRKDYISIVIHYIDNDWVLHKHIICFCLVDVRHTCVNIAQRIVKVLEDFSLQNCVIAFSMDNALSNDEAIEICMPHY